MPDKTSSNRSGHIPPSLHPPLHEAWRVALQAEAYIEAAPQIQESAVAVRCGHLVCCLDLNRGEMRWQKKVGKQDEENHFLASTSDFILTAEPNKLINLSWENGDEIWRARLIGEVMEYGLALNSQKVCALSVEESKRGWRYHIQEFDLKTGESLRELAAPSGADFAYLVADRLFFGSRYEEDEGEGQAGLYVLEPKATEPQKLYDGMVGRLRGGERTLVVGVEDFKGEKDGVLVFSLPKLEELWSSSTYGQRAFALGSDGREIAHIETRKGKDRVVLKEDLTGKVIWQSEPIGGEGLFVSFSADTVIAQDDQGFTLFDRAKGKRLWRIENPDTLYSWGAGIAPRIFVVGNHNEVICYFAD